MSDFKRNVTLNGPVPKNDPALFQKVRVKVLRPFYINGKLAEVDSIVSIEKHLSLSLNGIKISIVS